MPESFAEALYHQVHHNGRFPDVGALARHIGMRPGDLRDAANPNEHDAQFQARRLPALTVATGQYTVLDYIEREVGRVAVVVPGPNGGSREDLFEQTARLTRELGEAVETARAGLADGRLTAREVARIEDAIYQLLAATVSFKAAVLQPSEQAVA